jgi:hypothetical protein
VSTRFVFGLTGDAASSGLSWMGVDPSRENVDILEQWAVRREVVSSPDGDYVPQEPPECLMRDGAGRVGRIQVLDAETELLRTGFESNPTRLAAAAARLEQGADRLEAGQPPPLPLGAGRKQ